MENSINITQSQRYHKVRFVSDNKVICSFDLCHRPLVAQSSKHTITPTIAIRFTKINKKGIILMFFPEEGFFSYS